MRLATLAAAVVAGAIAASLVPVSAPEAAALTASDVVGVWKLRLGGDGWQRSAGETDESRVRGTAQLIVESTDVDRNTGVVQLQVVLDPETEVTLLGKAVPPKGTAPAFLAKAAVIGNSVSAIYTGRADYVNAMNLRFDPDGKHVTGSWFLAFPAADASDSAAFATGMTLSVKGKRVRTRLPLPKPVADDLDVDAGSLLQRGAR